MMYRFCGVPMQPLAEVRTQAPLSSARSETFRNCNRSKFRDHSGCTSVYWESDIGSAKHSMGACAKMPVA